MYKIIKSSCFSDLESYINSSLEEGYKCIGGLSVISHQHPSGTIRKEFYQAIIKEEKEKSSNFEEKETVVKEEITDERLGNLNMSVKAEEFSQIKSTGDASILRDKLPFWSSRLRKKYETITFYLPPKTGSRERLVFKDPMVIEHKSQYQIKWGDFVKTYEVQK